MKEEFIYHPGMGDISTIPIFSGNIDPNKSKKKRIITIIIISISIVLFIISFFDMKEIIKNPNLITNAHKVRYFLKMILFVIISICLLLIPGEKIDLKIIQFLSIFYLVKYFLIYSYLISKR